MNVGRSVRYDTTLSVRQCLTIDDKVFVIQCDGEMRSVMGVGILSEDRVQQKIGNKSK